MDQRDKILAEIASRLLDLETLETRNSDSLDFREQSVWSIKAALEAAYEAGQKSSEAVPPKRRGKAGNVIALPIKKQ